MVLYLTGTMLDKNHYNGIKELFLFYTIVNLSSGGYSTGVPPLPIPNREVKPGHVDGTA